jgi:hypothetical protein
MPQVQGREASMSGLEAAVAIFLLIAFIGGAAIGVVVIVSIASRREDKLFSLSGEAPDALCRGARRFTGLWTRGGRPIGRGAGERDDTRREEALR